MRRLFFTAFLALTVLAPVVRADTYPSKPVKVIIPWPAGGYADSLGRLVALKLGAALGQSVVVENRGGSNGLIGAAAAAKSTPDGYTLMFHSVTSHVINPALYKQVPYEADDLFPVSVVASAPLLLVATNSFESRTLKDMLLQARASAARPLSVASFGAGSASHLAIELLKQQSKVELLHVPYRGGGPALVDTIAGTVPLYFSAFGVGQPMVAQGKLRALAVTSKSRIDSMPNTPTVAEAANLPEFEMSVAYALWVPKGTPMAIQQRLADELKKIVAMPDFQQRLAGEGATGPIASTPVESAAFARAETRRLTALIDSANIKLD